LPPSQACRVLVVEDETMVAMLVEDMLVDLGCEVAAVAGSLAAGLQAAGEPSLDAAILDVNLNGEKSFPVAALLRERGVPFAFATGYGARGLDEPFAGTPTLQKPFTIEDLRDVLEQIGLTI